MTMRVVLMFLSNVMLSCFPVTVSAFCREEKVGFLMSGK